MDRMSKLPRHRLKFRMVSTKWPTRPTGRRTAGRACQVANIRILSHSRAWTRRYITLGLGNSPYFMWRDSYYSSDSTQKPHIRHSRTQDARRPEFSRHIPSLGSLPAGTPGLIRSPPVLSAPCQPQPCPPPPGTTASLRLAHAQAAIQQQLALSLTLSHSCNEPRVQQAASPGSPAIHFVPACRYYHGLWHRSPSQQTQPALGSSCCHLSSHPVVICCSRSTVASRRRCRLGPRPQERP